MNIVELYKTSYILNYKAHLTPKSKKACVITGIEPESLFKKSFAFFKKPGMPDSIAKMHYDHHEALRKQNYVYLMKEREGIIQSLEQENSVSDLFTKRNNGLDNEERKLAQMKRYQKNEMKRVMSNV